MKTQQVKCVSIHNPLQKKLSLSVSGNENNCSYISAKGTKTKLYILIFGKTKTHKPECHTTAKYVKLKVYQFPGKKSNQKICQRMRSALCYLYTNLTFDSNTSPGRNFPTCRQIIEMKANEMKQRIKPDGWE